ncbi:DNA repair protein RadC [Neobacillus notoginsengisoli]|uniref:DNA repair protein RadC n=1 Tax=Neobacillus notoginsengisoli TaxID=1578198 RepID=A0A417YQ81_9BACI|nr:DNA repair protein RadC [Neobacillus notoginsengisoli]RHW35943.1 DNA repair protein RadC [Neobacillus notoginsengisoli]
MNKHFAIAKEELLFYGTENTSLQNLLAVLIGSKANPSITGQLASLGVKGLSSLSKEELLQYEGVGESAANRILASLGLAGLMNKYKIENKYTIRSPEDAARLFSDMSILDQEQFEVVFLNTKNVVIGRKTIFKGTLNASIVHPRDVFREALKLSAASIIVAHQHPSGDPTPSREDIEISKRLAEVGKLMGIDLLDHIIIGSGRFRSIKELGHL